MDDVVNSHYDNMILDIATSAWLIDFCHRPYGIETWEIF